MQRCLVQKSQKGKDSPVGLPVMSCWETESPAVGVQNGVLCASEREVKALVWGGIEALAVTKKSRVIKIFI